MSRRPFAIDHKRIEEHHHGQADVEARCGVGRCGRSAGRAARRLWVVRFRQSEQAVDIEAIHGGASATEPALSVRSTPVAHRSPVDLESGSRDE